MRNASRRGVLDPCNRTLKFWESRRTPKSSFQKCECHPHTLPKVGLRHYASPRGPHPNGILSRDSQVGMKSPKLGLLQLWGPIISRAHVRLRWGIYFASVYLGFRYFTLVSFSLCSPLLPHIKLFYFIFSFSPIIPNTNLLSSNFLSPIFAHFNPIMSVYLTVILFTPV